MRWLFFALVAANLVYPAWKLTEASRAPKSAQTSAAPVRTGDRLVLLSEAEAIRSGSAARPAPPVPEPRVVPDEEPAGAGQQRGERSAASSEGAESSEGLAIDAPVPQAAAGMPSTQEAAVNETGSDTAAPEDAAPGMAAAQATEPQQREATDPATPAGLDVPPPGETPAATSE
jgi:hypothetical protein